MLSIQTLQEDTTWNMVHVIQGKRCVMISGVSANCTSPSCRQGFKQFLSPVGSGKKVFQEYVWQSKKRAAVQFAECFFIIALLNLEVGPSGAHCSPFRDHRGRSAVVGLLWPVSQVVEQNLEIQK